MRAAPWLLLPMLIIGWDRVTPQTHWSLARTIWLWSRHPSPSAELRMTVSTGCQAAAFSRVGTPWPTSGLRGCRHSTAGAARLLQRSGGGILARRSS
jgi:hypothetical protein